MRRRRTSEPGRQSRHVPERTCIGCRRRAPRHELVRFAAVRDGERLVLVRDDGGLGGRGVYTCASRTCFETALARRGFARAARADVKVDASLADGLGNGEAVGGA